MSDKQDPFALFSAWFADAEGKEPNDPNAMALATVGRTGVPDLRMVLLKGFDAEGFVFYTNLESAKGGDLAYNPAVALLFHWKSLRRQVRVQGKAEPVSDAEADAYFATRPRDSQIGAWASRQSRPLESRFALEREVARYALKFGVGPVPRPPFWSGFRVVPARFEFWTDKPFRLHERLIFNKEGTGWRTGHLFP
jgi:pyridoxamine 5'-phosphate oxidase